MIQLALMGFGEFVLHLTRMNPDQMYLHQDCGYLSIAYFKFDIDEVTGEITGIILRQHDRIFSVGKCAAVFRSDKQHYNTLLSVKCRGKKQDYLSIS